MPRLPAKTYGRSQASAASNKAFDDMLRDNTTPSASQAAPTIHRWGKTSFTSKRNAEPENRKRKVEDDVIEIDSPPEPGLFDDPFSFDSDDDAPSQPKRGMGFKGNKNRGKKVSQASSMRTIRLDEDKKVDVVEVSSNIKKSNVTKTYTQLGKAALAKSGTATLPNQNASDGKIQLLDKFTLKVSSKSTGGAVLTNSGTVLSNKYSSDRWNQLIDGSNKTRKFFTSTQQNSVGSSDDHTYSQSSVISVHSSGSDGEDVSYPLSETDGDDRNYHASDHTYHSPRHATSPIHPSQASTNKQSLDFAENDPSSQTDPSPAIWQSDYDSDWDKDSGDPEIIFNSPRKKRLQQVTLQRSRVVSSSPVVVDSSEDNTDSNSVCSDHSAIRYAETRDALHSIKTNTGSKPTSNKGSLHYQQSSLKERDTKEKRKLLLSDANSKDKKKRDEPLVRRLLTSPKKSEHKAKASYNPRPWHDAGDDDDPDVPDRKSGTLSRAGTLPNAAKSSSLSSFDMDDDDDTILPPKKLCQHPVLRKSKTDPARPWDGEVTALKVERDHKPLFTVVRNVKQAHECLEHGETQEFQDELDYILPGLRDTQPVATRCLSTISLATKCTAHAFRMHLRAHGDLTRIFTFLHDAPKHPATLGLCTSTLMFMNSRDRLHMDLERSDLTLMLQLLDCEAMPSNNETEALKVKNKLEAIIEQFRREGNVKDFVLEEISVGKLAMEALLSMTSRRSGDWLKEELRVLGGLDHIVNTVTCCAEKIDGVGNEPSEAVLNQCHKVDRCLRVLENVTYLNSENQMYLITYKSSALIKSLHRILRVCEHYLASQPVTLLGDKVDKSSVGFIMLTCLLAVFRTLLNITHENTTGATKLGQQENFIALVLKCILKTPQLVPSEERFDLYVLGLGLTINLVEHCDHNRRLLLKSTAHAPFEYAVQRQVEAFKALTMLFVKRYEAARKIEEEHDAQLDKKEQRCHDNLPQQPNTNNSKAQSTLLDKGNPNQSGSWQESESGLEWVVSPADQRDSEAGSSDQTQDGLSTSQEEDENFTEALHKAGKHMEDSIVAAYVALLVGCLLQHNSELAEAVRKILPGSSFVCMIRMLKKFLGFMNFTSGTVGNTGGKSIMRVIELLESCDG